MARSPLNATAPGTTAGLTSLERSAVPIRALGGLSSFGQPVEKNESVNKHNGSPNFFSHTQNPRRSCPMLGIKPKLHCNQGKTQKHGTSSTGSYQTEPVPNIGLTLSGSYRALAVACVAILREAGFSLLASFIARRHSAHTPMIRNRCWVTSKRCFAAIASWIASSSAEKNSMIRPHSEQIM